MEIVYLIIAICEAVLLCVLGKRVTDLRNELVNADQSAYFDEKIKSLEKQMDASDAQVRKLTADLEKLSLENRQLKQANEQIQKDAFRQSEKDMAFQKENAYLKSRFENLEADNHILLNRLHKAEAIVQDVKKENVTLLHENNLLKKQIEELKKKKEVKVEQPPVEVMEAVDPFSSLYPADAAKIAILFKDGNYQEDYKSLCDVAGMKNAIETSSFKKADMFGRLLKTYVNELEDTFDDFDPDEEDEDEISTICIDKFARCFDQYFAAQFIDPLSRGLGEDPFYKAVLDEVIKYLARNHIYSRKIQAGSTFEGDIVKCMKSVPEKTEDKTMHKHIKEILTHPYYARYTNDSGKAKEKLLCKGSCVVLTAR